MSLSAGTKLGPYEIVAPLGAGGMGEVSRARYTSPIPPAPRGATISEGPSLLPGARGISRSIIALE